MKPKYTFTRQFSRVMLYVPWSIPNFQKLNCETTKGVIFANSFHIVSSIVLCDMNSLTNYKSTPSNKYLIVNEFS